MNKKWVTVPFLVITIVVAMYLFYDGKPKPFPDNTQAIKAMNELYAEANVSEISDIIPLDSKHVFVPFTSGVDHYGKSFWEWDRFQWKLRRIDTRGEPYVWKINGKDASTHFIVWNIDPKDKLSEIKYYLIGERTAYESDGLKSYRPRVQMELTIALQKNYGVQPLPTDWVELMNGNLRMNNTNQFDSIFHMNSPSSSMYIGWIPYGTQGKEVFPNNTVNGSSFDSGGTELDFVQILNENELELPRAYKKMDE